MANSPHYAASLDQVCRLLDGLGSQSEAILGKLIEEFRSLAAGISGVTTLAGEIVALADAETLLSIPGEVDAIAEHTHGFIGGWAEAGAGMLATIENEQHILEMLLRLNADNRSISREIRMLSMLTNVEVARLSDSAHGFQYLAREMQAASESISAGAAAIAQHGRSSRIALKSAEGKLSAALPRLHERFKRVEAQLRSARTMVNAAIEELAACPNRLKASVDAVADQISNVVSAVQAQDITRQQTEHVRDALVGMAAGLHAGAPDLTHAARLHIQMLQLRNVAAAMGAWSSQIDQCFESILQISESQLEQIAPLVVAQETLLSKQLLTITEIERECKSESAEVARGCCSLSSLVALVQQHALAARVTLSSLRLLSFNSTIEARNFGSRADVMLEVSSNISRISSQWSQMAEKSARMEASIRTLMERAQDQVALMNPEGNDIAAEARARFGNSLARLKAAARSAAQSSEKIRSSIAALRERIASACALSKSLSHLRARIDRSAELVSEMYRSAADSGADGGFDPAQLEEEYSQRYSTAIERNILRTALYGEQLPGPETSIAGNGVELF